MSIKLGAHQLRESDVVTIPAEIGPMTTSVYLLHELLSTAVKSAVSPSTVLIDAIGYGLCYEKGEDGKVFAFSRDLTLKVEEDLISALSNWALSDALLYFNKFRHLTTMPIYGKSVHELSLCGNILAPRSLYGLVTLHSILAGKLEPVTVGNITNKGNRVGIWL